MKVRTKLEVCRFSRSWDNSGYLQTLGNAGRPPRNTAIRYCRHFDVRPCQVSDVFFIHTFFIRSYLQLLTEK